MEDTVKQTMHGQSVMVGDVLHYDAVYVTGVKIDFFNSSCCWRGFITDSQDTQGNRNNVAATITRGTYPEVWVAE